jgi:hypothetical protein
MVLPICSNGQARNGYAMSIGQYGIRQMSHCIAETVESISAIAMARGGRTMACLPRMSPEDAEKHLTKMGAVSEDGGLYNLGWYLGWSPGDDEVTLDGKFTVKDLLAIATYIQDRE